MAKNNTGTDNTGDNNSGDRNSGNRNSTNREAGIFKEVTGIDVEVAEKPNTIDIGGTVYEVTDELKDALKKLKKV